MAAEARADVNLDVLRQFSNLQLMQQAQTNPSASPFGILPPLSSCMIPMPTGWASSKMISYAAAGRGAPLAGLFRGLFVSMDTMAQWNTHDLGRVSATIDPPHIEAPHIDAPPISGVLIEAPHISAPNISAPSGIGLAASLSHA
jgi:hypothetical protein